MFPAPMALSVAYIGHIVEGHFNKTPLVGLNWAALYKWPGEIKDRNGKRQIVIDETYGASNVSSR